MAAEHRVLIDTQLLLWAAVAPEALPSRTRRLLESGEASVGFSVASLWEVAIKHSLGRADFSVEPGALRDGLLAAGFEETPIEPDDVIRVAALPWIHRDPFDRLLVVQAAARKRSLLTADRTLLRYGRHVRLA